MRIRLLLIIIGITISAYSNEYGSLDIMLEKMNKQEEPKQEEIKAEPSLLDVQLSNMRKSENKPKEEKPKAEASLLDQQLSNMKGDFKPKEEPKVEPSVLDRQLSNMKGDFKDIKHNNKPKSIVDKILDKAEPTALELKLIEIKKKYNIKDEDIKDIKKGLVESAKSDMKDLFTFKNINIKESFNDAVSKAKKTILNEKKKKSKGFFEGLVDDVKDTFKFKKDEKKTGWELPTFFGFNKKKREKTLFGSTILGGIKDTGSTYYNGFKYSGKSAEAISGMFFYNAKIYNTMFDTFDSSPFNIFEEEEEESIFNIFD